MSITNLLKTTEKACHIITPVVVELYNSIDPTTMQQKKDNSIFTIADGLVQHLLSSCLFQGEKFKTIVGEENVFVNISSPPFIVDNLHVPERFNEQIDSISTHLESLAAEISSEDYKNLSVFIDPIDGTREFSTQKGGECSICIGFSDEKGKAVGGIVFRPLTNPVTYALGCAKENFFDGRLFNKNNEVVQAKKFSERDSSEAPVKGILTSNGSISPFIQHLIEDHGFVRVPSGGAGNKMLMLLEGKGSAYIQDRGVSRWDTCAAEAVIEAYGGVLAKLYPILQGKTNPLDHYTYLASETNLDFIPEVANLTAYNSVNQTKEKGFGTLEQFKPYSNLLGLFAIANNNQEEIDQLYAAMKDVIDTKAKPSYD